METLLIPYLYFDGNCREAMEFYHECLGGKLYIQTVNETPMASELPSEFGDRVIHAEIQREAISLMASDVLRDSLQIGNQVALLISCSSKEEIDSLFSHLSQAGIVSQPVKQEFWGAYYAYLTDKFGIKWQLSFFPLPS